MEVSKEREREVLIKKIEQTRRLFAATTDERKIEGMKKLLHALEAELRQMNKLASVVAVRDRRTEGAGLSQGPLTGRDAKT
jgi:hypothetical protein